MKHALAIVKSLGKKGIRCAVVDRSVFAQSFYSRYCSKRYVVPDPEQHERAFMSSLMALVKSGRYDVLLPVGWHPNYYAAKAKATLYQYTNIPIAPRESMQIAANKDLTMAFARESKEKLVGFPVLGRRDR